MGKKPTRELLRFRAFIRELMRENDWSEQSIAARFGVSQATINNILNDAQAAIKCEYIRIAIEQFGLDPWYFFDAYDDIRSYHDYPSEKTKVQAIPRGRQ